MLPSYSVRFFYALESISYLLAIWAWWRVWRDPQRAELALAAICTCSGFGVKFFRVALLLMMTARPDHLAAPGWHAACHGAEMKTIRI